MKLEPGSILEGRYSIEKQLHRGARSSIFLAHDTKNPKPVVVKQVYIAELSAGDRDQAISRYEREAALLVQVEHPGIARVSDFFVANRDFFLVMEFVEGETLWEVVARDGAAAPSTCMDWIQQLCGILQYLHETHHVVFGDLRPANIMVDQENRLHLIDFGMARMVGNVSLTTQRHCAPGFAPLEHYGQTQPDPRTDIYGLGATWYYLLTATVPPEAPERAFQGTPLVPPSQVNSNVPSALDPLLARMMGLRKEDRFPDIQALQASLRALPPDEPPVDGSEPVKAPPAETWVPDRYRILSVLKRRPLVRVSLVQHIESGQKMVCRYLLTPPPADFPGHRLAPEAGRQFLVLDHPGLQRVRDIVAGPEGTCFLSDFLPGYPLDLYRQTAVPLPPQWICMWTYQLLSALDYLHHQPTPIYLGYLDPSDVVIHRHHAVLVDLRLFDQVYPDVARLVTPGSAPEYLAPEFRSLSLRHDGRADLFSVGATAFWLLTGLHADTTWTTAAPVLDAIQAARPDAPGGLMQVVADLLNFYPEQRPHDTQEALARLLPVIHRVAGETPPMPVGVPPLSEDDPAPWAERWIEPATGGAQGTACGVGSG